MRKLVAWTVSKGLILAILVRASSDWLINSCIFGLSSMQMQSFNLDSTVYRNCYSQVVRFCISIVNRKILSGLDNVLYEQLRGKLFKNYRTAVFPYYFISTSRSRIICSAQLSDKQQRKSRCKINVLWTCYRNAPLDRSLLNDISNYNQILPHFKFQTYHQPNRNRSALTQRSGNKFIPVMYYWQHIRMKCGRQWHFVFKQSKHRYGCIFYFFRQELVHNHLKKEREIINQMIYEQEQIEKNSITIFINIELNGVEREITFAVHSNTARLFTIGSFLDNEHYTYLESLLIQTNPKEEDSLFEVHAIIPAIKSERKKVLEKFAEYSTKICEGKLGRGDLQLPMTFLLKKSYNMYNKELQNLKLRMVLEKLLEVINVERDNSNKAQFDLKLINPKSSMMLDKSTINAIQIFSKDMEKKTLSANTTLYDIFNQCKTSFGTRCLKRWMKQPLQNIEELEARLDKIQFFATNSGIKNLIQTQLKKLPDLDRLYFVFYKVAAGKKVKCEVSDLMKIYRVVESLLELIRNLQNKDLSDRIIQEIYAELKENVSVISKISKMIEKGIDMSGSKDNQFYVRPETQASLEAIMKQKKEIESQIAQEVFKVGKHLNLEVQKIPSNTHKYVLEANKKLAINKVKQTPGYKFLTAKQTKITFITDNLSRLCERLNIVEEEYKTEQQSILKQMFVLIAGYYPVMEELSFILSQLDVLTTIATVVITSNGMWCRPRFTNGIVGKGMRHPCIKNCIPNDCEMTDRKTIVLTGPNMGGKSTYIRTIGVCTYLAHIGCYVPAVEFQTPIVDAIITRVGASDLQVKGISTFMSEMLESSCMLQTATKNSLVLIDQLGRGTSTSEGFGIAWQICEYLHREINPFCLFATHFHEMTRMADEVKGVKNMYTTCRVENEQLMLEYRVEEGKMQKSYGIQVMKILKFSPDVVDIAQKYLKYYECNEAEDQEINSFPEAVKTTAYQLIDELEEQLSRSPNDLHEAIRSQYKMKFKQILGNA